MKPLHDGVVTRERVDLPPKTVLAYRRRVNAVKATSEGVRDYEDELEDIEEASLTLCASALYDE